MTNASNTSICMLDICIAMGNSPLYRLAFCGRHRSGVRSCMSLRNIGMKAHTQTNIHDHRASRSMCRQRIASYKHIFTAVSFYVSGVSKACLGVASVCIVSFIESYIYIYRVHCTPCLRTTHGQLHRVVHVVATRPVVRVSGLSRAALAAASTARSTHHPWTTASCCACRCNSARGQSFRAFQGCTCGSKHCPGGQRSRKRERNR